MKETRILITGANGAMAKETIKCLIKDGYGNITMACRTDAKGNAAKKEIEEVIGIQNSNLKVAGGFDMNKPDEIGNAVKSLAEGKPFDIIFLAAGFAVFTDDYQTIEWNGKKVEKTVFQNLVGSHITLSHLKANDLLNNGVRVVIAGGEGARGIKGMIDKPTFDSAQQFRQYILADFSQFEKYNPMNAIGVSKLAGALWTKKLAQIEKDNMKVVWFSPGLTSGSEGLKKLPALKRTVFKMMFSIMNLLGKSQSAAQGGQKYADCLEGKVGKNGDLIGAPEGKALGNFTDQTPMNTAFSDQGLIDELWKILEEVCGPFGDNNLY